MESIIVITVLIMACIFCVIGLGEISKLTKENKDLQKTLEAEQQLRETEADRYELIIEANASRIKEEVAKRQEAERKLKVAEDCQTSRVYRQPAERKRLVYRQAIRHWEVDDLEKATNYAAGVMIQNVVDDLQKYIVKEEDVRHCETIYSLDIWV